jgi:hypothetical protein
VHVHQLPVHMQTHELTQVLLGNNDSTTDRSPAQVLATPRCRGSSMRVNSELNFGKTAGKTGLLHLACPCGSRWWLQAAVAAQTGAWLNTSTGAGAAQCICCTE